MEHFVDIKGDSTDLTYNVEIVIAKSSRLWDTREKTLVACVPPTLHVLGTNCGRTDSLSVVLEAKGIKRVA